MPRHHILFIFICIYVISQENYGFVPSKVTCALLMGLIDEELCRYMVNRNYHSSRFNMEGKFKVTYGLGARLASFFLS